MVGYGYSLLNSNDQTPHMEIAKAGEYRIIKTDNGNIVEYKIRDLLQNHPYTDLVPFDIWLENIEQSTSFIIPVEINAKELPEKIKRFIEVNIIIEGENEKKPKKQQIEQKKKSSPKGTSSKP